jgi:hypothetical protein
MNPLDLHSLSIGLSLQRPISKQDIQRRDEWLDSHTMELFGLAKEALETRKLAAKVFCRCHECGSTGDHATADCPFPTKHVSLFPELG